MDLQSNIRKHPLISFYFFAFAISWLGAFSLVASKILHGISLSKMDGLLMFPVMVMGPFISGIIVTYANEKENGLKELWAKILKWRSIKWYWVSWLVPPTLIMIVLTTMDTYITPAFRPNFFAIGFLFGVPAGIFEEVGWTGYAVNNLIRHKSLIQTGLITGVFWGLWHFPVIDSLGAASPHKEYLLKFFIAFIMLLTALRILMTWLYSRTQSILLIQLLHIVSTGSLVVLGPFGVSPLQETQWYFFYAITLWLLVGILLLISKKQTL
jgi:membrane protease YdiL (CAAX protease family)